MANTAMLCPRCKQLIGSDEIICPRCGASRINTWWKIIAGTWGSLSNDWLVNLIIIVNMLLYIFSLILTRDNSFTINLLSLLAPDRSSLLLLGATGTVPVDKYGLFTSFLSANYLHGGILHIIFNLMAFRQIGPWVSLEYGTARMFSIYTLGGVGGYVVSYLAGIPFTIGASAAICALIGSLLYYGKSRGGTYGALVYREVWGWIVSLIMFAFIIPGINNWAHGGGIIIGVILGIVLGYSEKRRETMFNKVLAITCGVPTILILVWVMVSAVALRFVN